MSEKPEELTYADINITDPTAETVKEVNFRRKGFGKDPAVPQQ